jgi:metal-sulfur cluster biosynthetic enzyme
VRTINDPEHPLTLEELSVVEESLVKVDDDNSTIHINFTPTIPHCSMATLIGLAIRVKLLRSLPERFKVDVQITPGSHASEDAGKYGLMKCSSMPNDLGGKSRPFSTHALRAGGGGGQA